MAFFDKDVLDQAEAVSDQTVAMSVVDDERTASHFTCESTSVSTRGATGDHPPGNHHVPPNGRCGGLEAECAHLKVDIPPRPKVIMDVGPG